MICRRPAPHRSPASAGSYLAVLAIPMASCRPAAPTGQICQHPEHGIQDDHRRCSIESQALKDPDIPEAHHLISAAARQRTACPTPQYRWRQPGCRIIAVPFALW